METKSHQRYHDEDGRNMALLTTELGFFNGQFDGRGAAQTPELMHGRRGVGAFRGCALLCIVIPPAIRAIKARGYRDCSGLTTVILNNWLEEIGVWALDESRSLVRAKIPLGIRAIKNFAFRARRWRRGKRRRGARRPVIRFGGGSVPPRRPDCRRRGFVRRSSHHRARHTRRPDHECWGKYKTSRCQTNSEG